jgi:hypothetical protein
VRALMKSSFLILGSNESNIFCATGVAKGAILRACDKENGPARMPRLSYGFLRHLEYQNEKWLAKKFPAIAAAMKHGERTLDKIDGKYWVNDTIQWIIKSVCKLSNSSDTSLTPRNRAKGP